MASFEEAQTLFDKNKGLAIHTVYSKYSKFSQTNIEDLKQEAFLALWQACLSYDESRGVKFSSYALPYIIAAVASAARDLINTTVYYPKSIKTVASKLLKHYGSIEAICASKTLYEDFAQYTKESIQGAIQFLQGPVPMQTVTADGEDFNLLDVIADPESELFAENVAGRDLIEGIRRELDDDERAILDALLIDCNDPLPKYSPVKVVKVKHKVLKLYEKKSGVLQ